jgi:hypothetical protein
LNSSCQTNCQPLLLIVVQPASPMKSNEAQKQWNAVGKGLDLMNRRRNIPNPFGW